MSAGSLFSSSKIEVPNLIGIQLTDAVEQYKDNFTIIEGSHRADEHAEDGEILDQDPAATSKVAKKSTITVVICKNEDDTQEDDDIIKLDESIIGGIIGENYESVENKLSGLGLKVDITRQKDATVEKDNVIKISPPIGEEVKKGDSVTLYVSDGPEEVEIPNVVGNTVEQAKATLSALNLTVNTNEEYNDAPAGQVFKQVPDSGTKTQPNTAVTLYVSKGPENKPEEKPSTDPEQQQPPQNTGDPEQSGSSGDPEQSGVEDTPEAEGSYQIVIPINAQNQVTLSVHLSDGTDWHSGAYDPANGAFTATVHGPVGKSDTVSYYINGTAGTMTFVYQ